MIPSGQRPEAAKLAERLGVAIDAELLDLALTHRSFCAERPGHASNERLEFLGDAVLGLIVTDHLYASFPDLPEGDLARMRAAVVSLDALAPIAAGLGLGEALRLGRGEQLSGGRAKPSLLADALEALLGALYLSGGLPAARAFVLDRFGAVIAEVAQRSMLGDPKNALQELAAQLGEPLPSYRLVEHGPDHAKSFEAVVALCGVTGRGRGRSKKEAERRAAAEALAALGARGTPAEVEGA